MLYFHSLRRSCKLQGHILICCSFIQYWNWIHGHYKTIKKLWRKAMSQSLASIDFGLLFIVTIKVFFILPITESFLRGQRLFTWRWILWDLRWALEKWIRECFYRWQPNRHDNKVTSKQEVSALLLSLLTLEVMFEESGWKKFLSH